MRHRLHMPFTRTPLLPTTMGKSWGIVQRSPAATACKRSRPQLGSQRFLSVFINAEGRVAERDLPSLGRLPRRSQQPELDQAEARSQELQHGLRVGRAKSKYSAMIRCLPSRHTGGLTSEAARASALVCSGAAPCNRLHRNIQVRFLTYKTVKYPILFWATEYWFKLLAATICQPKKKF